MINARISYKTLKALGPDELRARMGETPEQAAPWVRAAAYYGLKNAQVTWGQMLLDGRGAARDPQAAFRWFRIAAEAGNLDGVNMVGRCYQFGWGVAPDTAEAERHYRAAAEGGHAWAQFNLAALLHDSPGFAADPAQALGWYVRAARGGNPKAMAMIGRFLEHGWGRPRRAAAARRWYRRAALGGDYRGQFDLARTRYEDGDFAEAVQWFARSIETGVPDFCRLAAVGLRAAGHPVLDRLADRALERVREAEAEERTARATEAAMRRPKPRRRLGLAWLRRRRS